MMIASGNASHFNTTVAVFNGVECVMGVCAAVCGNVTRRRRILSFNPSSISMQSISTTPLSLPTIPPPPSVADINNALASLSSSVAVATCSAMLALESSATPLPEKTADGVSSFLTLILILVAVLIVAAVAWNRYRAQERERVGTQKKQEDASQRPPPFASGTPTVPDHPSGDGGGVGARYTPPWMPRIELV